MSKILSGVVTLAAMCALSLFLSCGSSSSRPAGVLYTVTQGLNGSGNSVSSFGMNLDNGELEYINSNASTCPTPSTTTDSNPCGLPVDILLDPRGATAFILDQGVPTLNVAPAIYPYTVNSDGSLAGPGTAINWTSTTQPDLAVAMVRDAAGQFLFVIDQGAYPSPLNCPAAGTPGANNPMYVGCPSVSVFTMKQGSPTTLTLGSNSPYYTSKLPTALSAVASPSSTNAQELLFVTNNLDICTVGCNPPHNDNTVSVYAIGSDGTLTEQKSSPYTVAATNPVSVMAVNTNPVGQPGLGGLFVYVGTNVQTGGGVYPFQICTVINAVCTTQADVDLALLTPLQTCTQQCIPIPPTAAGLNPAQMAVDPTNNFLYVLSEGSSQLFGFRVNTSQGTLTALSPASQPTGTQPFGMALHASVNSQGQNIYSASGQFLYVSNTLSSNITAFGLSTANGTMSSLGTQIAPAAPTGIAVH
jgi:hypothetical protein